MRLGYQFQIDITAIGSHVLDTRTKSYIGGLVAWICNVSNYENSDYFPDTIQNEVDLVARHQVWFC